MADPMETAELKDLTRAPAILADACENASRALKNVDTAFGSAVVVADDYALDIDFNDRDVSVHVRFERDKNAT